jgi:cytochrome c oxidase subunit 1
MADTAAAVTAPGGADEGRTTLPPPVRAALWAAIGFGLGAAVTAAARVAIGSGDVWAFEPVMVVGYTFALIGWLLGIGLWDAAGRQWFAREPITYRAQGWRRYIGFNTDHKVIGIQYGITFITLLLIAGLLAMTMRTELMDPGRTIIGPAGYNRLMSLHGFTMVLVAVTALPGAFGNYILPIMLGAEDMAFPRLNALSYWFWPPVAFLLATSLLAQGWDSGWTAYAPLSIVNQNGQLLYQLAFITAGLSSIVGAVNFIVTIKSMRAPGMSWGRMPIFAWSMLATAILSLLFTQSVAVVMVMSVLDRLGFGFFNPAVGGDVIAYQHIFWFYSHPAVYVMVLPALGVMLEVLAHFSRKPLYGYWWAVAGFLGITVLSGVVWAHHMFTSGMQPEALKTAFMATTEAISVPTGFIFLSALGTLWRGRMRLRVPALFALAVVFNFLIGGITGVYLSDVPADIALQDTYWVVAHFHYTIVGGGIFGLFAAIYYWFPKMTGRMYDETLGRWHFWPMFVGFNLTFLPMFWLGANGMNRRIADYTPDLGGVNLFVSLSAFVLGASFLPFIWNMIVSPRRGVVAGDNPWQARTLEWQTTSPPPELNFPRIPEVVSGPYDYGESPATPHGVVVPAGASSDEPIPRPRPDAGDVR